MSDNLYYIEQLHSIEQRLPALDQEEHDLAAGTHPSVIAHLQAGMTEQEAVERTRTVITNIRQHLLRRRRQFLAYLQSH